MRAERRDLKKGFGEITMSPEVPDDLWHLEQLIEPGSLVFATTLRTVETPSDRLRPEKAEKRPVRLGIRVEKVYFHHSSNRLRIHGVIEHGPDMGAHHTFNIEPGGELSVVKSWSALDLERITRAEASTTFGAVHILTIEDGEAQLFRIRQFGPEWVDTITRGSGKGSGIDGKAILFETVLSRLGLVTGPIVIAGPGFIKDDFMKFLKSEASPIWERCQVVETRSTGRSGVQEVIGQGVLERIAGDIQLEREVHLMSEFLTRIARGEPVAYGITEVMESITCGAAEQILVADSTLRDPRITKLLEAGEKIRATINVLSSAFEPGVQLTSLGGIAALLRYRIR